MDLTVRESPLVRAMSSPGERRSKNGRSWRQSDGLEAAVGMVWRKVTYTSMYL
jgi:hypothetical protein